MYLNGALCSIFITLICNVTIAEKNDLTFDPTPVVKGVSKNRICARLLLHLSFPLFDMQHDPVL